MESSTRFTFTPVGADVVPRFLHRASRLADGRVVVTGGLGVTVFPPSLTALDDIAIYDPADAAFARPVGADGRALRLIVPRGSHTQTTLADGRILVAGGRTAAAGTSLGRPLDSVEILDLAAGRIAPGPPMSETRADHSATRLADGRVVIAGGGTWQIFSPGPDLWSDPMPLARGRFAHAAVLLDGFDGRPDQVRVLLIGGFGSGPDTMELLDPVAATTELVDSTLDVGVDDLAAVALSDGRVLIVGGQARSGDTTDRSYLYDARNDRLTAAAAPPERAGGLADHQLIAVDHYACLFGGEQELEGVDTELDYYAVFDSRVDQWIAHGRMRHAHDDFPAVRLTDRAVLLIGGGAGLLGLEVPTSQVEVFELLDVNPFDP